MRLILRIINKLIKLLTIGQNTLHIAVVGKLLEPFDYIPWTASSISSSCLNLLLNDIVINKRKSILELGGGISTLAIASLIKKSNLDSKLYCIENSMEWIDLMKNYLRQANLEEYCVFIHAPIVQQSDKVFWYNDSVVLNALHGIKIDCLLIDGPEAWNRDIELSRYPAIQVLASKFEDNFGIFLDDGTRYGERKVCKMWLKEFGWKFKRFHDMKYYIHGKGYNIIPC